ncbi:MAG: serine/threonine-protein phosphatase, partial [Planctomycetaceae bacterium]|nr:serine/threonine-protein phosphatase [Planctomycetaceae bacterium]
MSVQPVVEYASRTDVGMRRSANQDSLAVRLCTESEDWATCGHLFVVADGMGGHSVGDLASRITVDTLPHAYFKGNADNVRDRLLQAVIAANKAVNDCGRQNPEFADMGTTCCALSLSEAGATIAHVGDSRIYRVRNGRIEQLTFDHSLQWEMIRLGQATIENVDLHHPRNVITRCIGPDPDVRPDIEGPFPVRAGDYFVISSDGLTNHVSDSEIGQIVSCQPVAESARLLINLANCRGGSDNSTVIVVHVQSYPSADVDDATGEHSLSTVSPVRHHGYRRYKVGAVVSAIGGLVLEGFAVRYFRDGDWNIGTVLAVTGVLLWVISYLFLIL